MASVDVSVHLSFRPPTCMSVLGEPTDQTYNSIYDAFDSPLMQRVRSDAYGEDIGQHSWVTGRELRGDIERLGLIASHHLLDIGCGPCGPLTYVLHSVRCRGTGLDVSGPAVAIGRQRAASFGLAHLATIQEADLNHPLPLESRSLDAAMALDVVLHLRDRSALFREVARVLAPAGRFLFTDAGVLTGIISNDEVASRSLHGHTQFVARGFNERALEGAGFRLLEAEDRTDSVLENAEGRCAARLGRRKELELVEGATDFARGQRYLETVIALSRRRSVLRMMYLAESNDS